MLAGCSVDAARWTLASSCLKVSGVCAEAGGGVGEGIRCPSFCVDEGRMFFLRVA